MVRDEMRALRGRILSLTQQFNNARKGSPDAKELTERINRTEDALHEREDCLREVQKHESDRQFEVIATRALEQQQQQVSSMRVACQSSTIDHTKSGGVLDLTRTTPVRGGGGAEGRDRGVCELFLLDSSCKRVVEFPTPPGGTRSPAETMLAVASAPSLVCIDCKIIPTTHTCRCRKFVCDLCCSTKRDLEMIWWWSNCFDAESLTNQRIIRDGKYQFDGDDDSDN